MRVKINLSLADYIERGNANTARLLVGDHPLMGLVAAYYDFFATSLWADGQPIARVPMFLSQNAFMLWTSGVRMAMSGHEAAVYSLFRTGLESACYALLVSRKPELAAIWSDRDKGEAERKACRKAFTPAVSGVAKYLGAKEMWLGDFISQCYETSIDFGAHPNSRGVMNQVQVTPPTADEERFDVGSIYPGDSVQVYRALCAAIDFGRAIAIILAYGLPVMSKGVVEALYALRDRQSAMFKGE